MAEKYDGTEFEIADKYDLLLEMYEAKLEEVEEQKYNSEYDDEEEFDADEYKKELFGDLARGDEYILVRYKGSAEKVVIPDGLAGIKAYAFANNKTLKSVVFPDSVQRIANGTFSGCAALTQVELSKNLTLVGIEAFKNCTALKSIEFPDCVTGIGGNAFEGCTALQSIGLGKSLQAVGREMFKNCTALKSVDIPDSVEIIRVNAFEGCTALESIRFGENVTGIGWNAFQDCKSLKKLKLPPRLEEIDMFLFENSGLQELYIPASVDFISNDAFAFCGTLRKVTVDPANKRYYNQNDCIYDRRDGTLIFGRGKDKRNSIGNAAVIEDHAFSGSPYLTDITFQDGLKKIGMAAFAGCKNLRRVVFPDSLEKIGYRAFDGCSALEEIVVPAGVEVVEACAFRYCGLKRAVVKRGVKKLEASVFAHNGELREVYIPSTVTDFGVSLFEVCHKDLCVFFETDDENSSWEIKFIKEKVKVVLGYKSDIFD